MFGKFVYGSRWELNLRVVLFSYTKVFPTRFYLGEFFKEAVLYYAPFMLLLDWLGGICIDAWMSPDWIFVMFCLYLAVRFLVM